MTNDWFVNTQQIKDFSQIINHQWQKQLFNPYSDDFLSDKHISMKCVLLRMWTPSILLSIHLSNSGDNRIATYSFTILNTYLRCNTSEHINIRFTISTFVKLYKTNRIEGEKNGGR